MPEGTTIGSIVIRNSFGQTIETSTIEAGKGSIPVDCSKYANGVYVVTMIVNKKVIATKKLVIAK
jgi:hypothetical protein